MYYGSEHIVVNDTHFHTLPKHWAAWFGGGVVPPPPCTDLHGSSHCRPHSGSKQERTGGSNTGRTWLPHREVSVGFVL